MSIGYGIKMTPLQILSFYATIANDGRRMKPYFVKSIMNNGLIEKTFYPEVINPSICSMTTIKIVKKMLEGVVQGGTAKNIYTKQYKIAGKTGTTQLLVDGVYNKERHLASFVGYFPAQKPKYACIVLINNPLENGSYGGEVAAPVFRQIADYVYNSDLDLYQADTLKTRVSPISKDGYKKDLAYVFKALSIDIEENNLNSEWVLTHAKEEKVLFSSRNINNDLKKNTMPNIIGMGLSDVLYLLENYGLKVNYKGRGTIKSQSISKGQDISKGQSITIELS